ncbi:LysE family translocator [Kiloniella sp. b19]|uniref:LysE family translocator n=1 Tax=Kiloniella sp. GXU_MW_B19 TaxID=3141326 RepID=UPI0031DE8EA7
MSAEFLITSLIVVLIPGTGVIYTLAVALGYGFRMAIVAALGCTLGILPAALASMVGLSALLYTSALAFQVIKFCGVAYLLYMAWSLWRDRGQLLPSDPGVGLLQKRAKGRVLQIARDGLLLNILNPKLALFFLAFLPQFTPVQQEGSLPHMLLLTAVFMVMTFVVFVAYAAVMSSLRKLVLERPLVQRWIRRSFAVTFGLLGLRLAFERS